jgi:hypothetical protein
MLLNPPRSDLTHAIVDMDGTAVSWHRSAAAAQHEIEREYRAFRRRYPLDGSRGNAYAYLPRSIIVVPEGGGYIARQSRYSTSWEIAVRAGEKQ